MDRLAYMLAHVFDYCSSRFWVGPAELIGGNVHGPGAVRSYAAASIMEAFARRRLGPTRSSRRTARCREDALFWCDRLHARDVARPSEPPSVAACVESDVSAFVRSSGSADR